MEPFKNCKDTKYYGNKQEEKILSKIKLTFLIDKDCPGLRKGLFLIGDLYLIFGMKTNPYEILN